MGAPPQEWAGSFNVQASLLAEDRAARGTEQSPSEREARHRFLQYLPPGYAEQTAPQVAARDWAEIFRLLDQEAAGPPEPGHGPAGDGAGDGPPAMGPPAMAARVPGTPTWPSDPAVPVRRGTSACAGPLSAGPSCPRCCVPSRASA